MITIIVDVSKYLIIFLGIIYTMCGYLSFRKNDSENSSKYNWQVISLFIIHFLCYTILFLKLDNLNVIYLYGAQTLFFALIIFLYGIIYKKASRLITNNICFLLMIGFVILTRLSFNLAVRQFAFSVVGVIIFSFLPLFMVKIKGLSKLGFIYGIGGLILLSTVFVLGTTKYGATNWISLGPISLQPSEFTKISFILAIAAFLYKSTSFKQVVMVTGLAAIHVLVLVAEKDLGGALIFFVVYVVMLFVATNNYLYFFGGLGGGIGGSTLAYLLFKDKMFSHVSVRITAWLDPWNNIDGKGYQIAQSLFAIGTGGWFGLGLTEGLPKSIPIVETDFIFSAIAEEMGVIFALCIVLICINNFIATVNISLKSRKKFNKYLAIGLGVCYLFQVFLTIGGVTKFIPSTGVTLPFVSAGGSSLMSSFLMFNIIQGLQIICNKEVDKVEKEKRKYQRIQNKTEEPVQEDEYDYF